MKVGKYNIQFNHKSKGYKTIEEVPYWRLYRVKRTKVKHYLSEEQIARWGTVKGKNYFVSTHNVVIDKSYHNYEFEDLEYLCEVMVERSALTKGEMFVAWPRKGCGNRRI